MLHIDMHANILTTAARLSDRDLLVRLEALAGRERHATVELVAHLAEFDPRKLHREQGYGSLFSYCTGALRLSEYAAFTRIEAARVSRRFPEVLDRLAEGALNLSTVRLLAPYLTQENHERLLEEARGRSKREVEAIAARHWPLPDVPPSVRKLPAPAAPVAVTVPTPPAPTPPAPVPPVVLSQPDAPERAPVAAPPSHRPVVTPLTPERYRIQFTVSRDTQERLRRLQDLLRREIPDGDPGAIFDRALGLLEEDVARRKLAATTNPRPAGGADPRSRHVPAEVKRKVWVRDHGRCAFVSPAGRRCAERAFLEFHHVEAYGRGGETTVENLSLRCREHNVYEAELLFGPWEPGAVSEARASYSTWSAHAVARHKELGPTRPGAGVRNISRARLHRPGGH
jgi:hypothetical protein